MIDGDKRKRRNGDKGEPRRKWYSDGARAVRPTFRARRDGLDDESCPRPPLNWVAANKANVSCCPELMVPFFQPARF